MPPLATTPNPPGVLPSRAPLTQSPSRLLSPIPNRRPSPPPSLPPSRHPPTRRLSQRLSPHCNRHPPTRRLSQHQSRPRNLYPSRARNRKPNKPRHPHLSQH